LLLVLPILLSVLLGIAQAATCMMATWKLTSGRTVCVSVNADAKAPAINALVNLGGISLQGREIGAQYVMRKE
jgi:hypothetical protein